MKLTATINKLFTGDGRIRAVATVVVDDAIAIHGIKVIDSPKGAFVSMPNCKIKDAYKDICHPIDSQTRALVNELVIGAYQSRLELERSGRYTVSQEEVVIS